VRGARRLTVPDRTETDRSPVAFSGEVWTDARGYATVALPRWCGQMHANATYELRPFTPGVTAKVAAELMDGRFTIETDEPHVKVAWRVTGRRPQRPTKEEE
jgi:hypothetical protein